MEELIDFLREHEFQELEEIELAPELLLARGDRLVASIAPGRVLVLERHQEEFAALSALAGELSTGLLRKLSAQLAHRFDAPLWITAR